MSPRNEAAAAKHLSITSANFEANKVNQNKIREVLVQSTRIESPNGPFWRHWCHFLFLRYQTIYFNYVTIGAQKYPSCVLLGLNRFKG